MIESKFKLGDIVQYKHTGTWGPVCLIRGLNGNYEYFIDPCPGAEAEYEYMTLYNEKGFAFFVAGNWFAEEDLEKSDTNEEAG